MLGSIAVGVSVSAMQPRDVLYDLIEDFLCAAEQLNSTVIPPVYRLADYDSLRRIWSNSTSNCLGTKNQANGVQATFDSGPLDDQSILTYPDNGTFPQTETLSIPASCPCESYPAWSLTPLARGLTPWWIGLPLSQRVQNHTPSRLLAFSAHLPHSSSRWFSLRPIRRRGVGSSHKRPFGLPSHPHSHACLLPRLTKLTVEPA